MMTDRKASQLCGKRFFAHHSIDKRCANDKAICTPYKLNQLATEVLGEATHTL